MDGSELVKRILDRRLTQCVTRAAHYPFERQPLVYDLRTGLCYPQAPIPANCRRCGIGGPYSFTLKNGRPHKAQVTHDL